MDVLLEKVALQLKESLAFDLTAGTEIHAGGNNRLFRLDSKDKSLLLKVYNPHNQRLPLQREFEGIAYLNRRGFPHIPQAYYKDDALQYAVYSFEDGVVKPVAELTKSDIEQMVQFIVTLQAIAPESVDESFLPAVMDCSCLNDYVQNIRVRLEKFQKAVIDNEVSSEVLSQLDPSYAEEIMHLVQDAVKGFSANQLAELIAADEKRLSPVDFGAHNCISQPDGSMIFIDFEYFGWDDPNRIVADFLAHDQSIGLSEELKEYFLARYRTQTTLPPHVLENLLPITQLISIEWLLIYLVSLTKQKIDVRMFANAHFEVTPYIAQQLAKYHALRRSLLRFD